MPSPVSCSASRFAPRLVRVNTRTWRQSSLPIRSDNSSRLRRLSTGMYICLTRSAGLLRCATSISDGRIEQVVRQSSNVVRESCREQQVLPFLGQCLDDFADVTNEAHVEHAIGFVEYQEFDFRQVDGPCCMWSSSRPGVATTMSTPLRSLRSVY